MYDVDLDKLCNAIKIKCNNLIEKNVILNILLSKVICIAGLKNLTFNSHLNIFGDVPYSHFGVNFIPSGGNKNNLINIVDDIFGFMEADINTINQKIKQDYIDDEMSGLSVYEQKKQKKKIEKKAEEQEFLLKYINDGSPAGLYNTAELIDRLKKGFICIKNTEFSSYYVQAAINKASNNQLFLDCLYDLWDGLFSNARKIKGLCRKEIKGITTSVIFMSSFIKMQDTNVMKAYRDDLLSGNVRRFLFVYNYMIDYFLNPPTEPTEEEQEEATRIITEYKEYLKTKYDNINPNSQYCVEKRVTDLIKEWYKQKCMPRLKELAKKSNSENNEIIKTYIFNCKWTILKLLNAYNLLINPAEPIIKDVYLPNIIEFWEQSLKALEGILYSKKLDTVDKLVNCFIDNQNQLITKTDIRKYCEIDAHTFKQIFEYNLSDVESILFDKGYNLTFPKGTKNTQNFLCKPIEQVPSDEKINISYTHTKYGEHPAQDYEWKEITLDEFKNVIKRATGLSPKKYKNGYRNDANVEADTIQNTLWLDFDDGLNIEEAKEIFKPYWYVIYTSINHQKPKHDKVCDRFRVVLKVKEPMPNDKERYNSIIANIIEGLGADKNANGISRYFRGNPEAIIYTNNGTYFDWKEYEQITPELIKITDTSKRTNYVGNGHERILCDENLFTSVGDDVLKKSQIVAGNRDIGMQRAIGILISAVNNGDLTHRGAEIWVEKVLQEITDKDFEQQAEKFRQKIKELKI